MVYVINKATDKIIHSAFPWELGKAEEWVKDNGYIVEQSDVTRMGDVMIFVREAA